MNKLKVTLNILSIMFMLLSCGGPPKSEIKWAIRQSLKERVPVALAHHLTGGSDAHIEELKIIQVGSKQNSGSNEYWPVKIYAKGTCIKMFGGRRSFEGETEYYVVKDPYGKWVARPSKGY